MNKNTDTFHKLVHTKLKVIKKLKGDNIIKRNEVMYILQTSYKIPREQRQGIIKEMEQLKLIKIKNQNNIEVL